MGFWIIYFFGVKGNDVIDIFEGFFFLIECFESKYIII